MGAPLIRIAFTVALVVCASARAAIAACGDTIVGIGEQCDDGNVADGDCCSSACQFEPINYSAPCDHGREGVCWSHTTGVCDGNGVCLPQAMLPWPRGVGRQVVLRDVAGDEHDSISWKLRPNKYNCYDDEPGGDPSIDTTYALCFFSARTFGPFDQYYLDELLYENVIPPGEGWRQTAKGWKYRSKDATGSLQIRAQKLASFKARGSYAALPGPANGSVYFDTDVWFALVNSAGFHDFMGTSGDLNTAEKFISSQHSSCD